ncbi:MAG: lipase maturation factor family protein [Pseudonocardiaceae bacterium]|nr:lipase maturation factor family protein [Pseudonocardiaceae bacterium]
MHWDWISAPEYWAGRLVLERLLAACYLLAFLAALHQFRALLGTNGLTPIPRFLRGTGFRHSPSVFHLHYSDRFFATIAAIGAVLAAITLLGLTERLPIWGFMAVWTVLWLLYLSIVNVGQVWYRFGWESLLLEAGFLAIFLGPADIAPPLPLLWAFCWLLFRVEFGAGLIKMRGDPCWRDLTCLYYHHETQPMPGPLSWYFHHLPRPLHKIEVLANHFAQLIVPFALFAPQPVADVAALIIIVTQLWLMVSGNFAWLNLVTITLVFATLSDAVLGRIPLLERPAELAEAPTWHAAVMLAVCALIVVLSYWPVRNLISKQQAMNRSFNKLHLGNTYGAFGGITRNRDELVIEGTDEDNPGPNTVWREYEFYGKPGDPSRRPRQIAPYHLRLDWLMWFAGISPRYAEGWLPQLVHKLLSNDDAALRLLRHNPFAANPPKFVRVRLYRYRFTTRAERRESGAWWARSYRREYLPAMSREEFEHRVSR